MILSIRLRIISPVKYFPDPISAMVGLVEDAMLYLATPTVLTDFLPEVKFEARTLVGTPLTGRA